MPTFGIYPYNIADTVRNKLELVDPPSMIEWREELQFIVWLVLEDAMIKVKILLLFEWLLSLDRRRIGSEF